MAPAVQIESLAETAVSSERALLGLLILEPYRFSEIELSTDDFGLSAHRDVYAAMNHLEGEGESWDVLTLSSHMESKGKLESAGGRAFLADLTTGIPRHMAVTSHICGVRLAACRRRAANILQNGLESAHDATVCPNTLISRVLGQMQRLSDGFDSEGNILPYSTDSTNGMRPELLCLSDVAPCEIDWLWEPYLPTGMLSMLSGDPGGGKTFLALAIAAALSNGETPFTLEPRKPVNTLYLSLENSPEYVVRPRFDLLKGNAKRFLLLQGILSGKSRQRGSISLKDIDLLKDALIQTEAGLLIVDPIQSYLGADVDAHRSNETRPVLDGLARIASEHDCCILLVRHLSKASGGRAIHRGLGSIDLTGAVRTELMVGTEADNPDSRALVQVKSNLGRFGDSLGFAIGEDGFRWTGKSHLTSSDLLAPEGNATTRTEIASAEEYLKDELAGGPKLQSEIVEGGNFSERTLQRAAQKIHVKRERDGERGRVLWRLE